MQWIYVHVSAEWIYLPKREHGRSCVEYECEPEHTYCFNQIGPNVNSLGPLSWNVNIESMPCTLGCQADLKRVTYFEMFAFVLVLFTLPFVEM